MVIEAVPYSDYRVQHFQSVTKAEYVADISADTVYCWLEMGFRKTINIKVDHKVKEGVTEWEMEYFVVFY
ncbi:hypothetical protein [Bacillus sp. Hm123]|uniref:hypothetical protein n=1 Tax=Bacillus sp. Hm123 TaxID=3450745 RepID=UPI003F42C1B9